MRPREYPDGDLAVPADCILEIPRYLQTLTVDWRRYVFLVRWRWRGSAEPRRLTHAGVAQVACCLIRAIRARSLRSSRVPAQQAVGSLHVPRRRGFVRPPDDFRRNLIGRKSWCVPHRLGMAKPRQLTARPHLCLRSSFPNAGSAGGVGLSTRAICVACRSRRRLLGRSTPSGRRCRAGPSSVRGRSGGCWRW
jgi:hypothetical protein